MSSNQCFVYSRCFGGGREPYLCVEFSGTRAQCRTFVRRRARAGRPTHFMVVSSLMHDAASRRFL